MKANEELTVLKAEAEALNKKLAELTGDELAQVSGGIAPNMYIELGDDWDAEDVRARFIDEPGDENVHVSKELMPTIDPPVMGKTAGLILSHF